MRYAPHPLLAALAAAAALSAARAQEQEPEPLRVQLAGTEMDVTVDYAGGSLAGSALLALRNASDRPVRRVPLQLHRLMRFTDARDAHGRPARLEQDVVLYADNRRHQVTQAWVTLPAPLAPGATTAVRVRWDGFLWGYVETGMLYVRDRVDSAFTILRDDAAAFPTPRVASWRANRALPPRDFDFALRVTVPAGQVVAAGGTLVGRTERAGAVTYEFRSDAAVPFLNVAIAPYLVAERGGLRVYHFAADSAGAAMVLRAIVAASALLERWFGPLGGEPRLTVMEIPEGFGSQASLAAGIIQDAAAFRDRRQLPQLYHELTHLWNAPDTDAPPVRWNEGLATFLSYKLAAELDGTVVLDRYVTERYLPRFLERFAADTTNASTPLVRFGQAGKTGLSYGVGFLMFHALHELVGADAFNRAVGGWYQERRTRGGTTDELVAHLDRSIPVDLGPFFRDWMYTTRWYERLRAGESLPAMIESYRR